VYLSINNFYNLAKIAYGSEFPYVDQIEFDKERLESHIKYFGEYHHSVPEIARSICYRLFFSKKDHDLLRYISHLRTKFTFLRIFPLEEEFKAKLMKRCYNPRGIELNGAAYSKDLKNRKAMKHIIQNWPYGVDYPLSISQKELEKNLIYPKDFLY